MTPHFSDTGVVHAGDRRQEGRAEAPSRPLRRHRDQNPILKVQRAPGRRCCPGTPRDLRPERALADHLLQPRVKPGSSRCTPWSFFSMHTIRHLDQRTLPTSSDGLFRLVKIVVELDSVVIRQRRDEVQHHHVQLVPLPGRIPARLRGIKGALVVETIAHRN